MMRKNLLLLKYLIETELKREARIGVVDEPKPVPDFGQVLFSPERIDRVSRKEKNTAIEDRLLTSILNHFEQEDELSPQAIKKILGLIQKGKFKELLKPPENTKIFRLLWFEEDGTRILKNIFKTTKPEKDKFIYVPLNNRVIKPPTEYRVQSWTTTPTLKALAEFMPRVIGEGDELICLLTTTVKKGNGTFILNPNFPKKVGIVSTFSEENEVISYGPVAVKGMSCFLVDTESNDQDNTGLEVVVHGKKQILNGLLKALMK